MGNVIKEVILYENKVYFNCAETDGTNKYGSKKVVPIITFGTLGAKQALRDVAKAMDIELGLVDSLCKFIPGITKDKLKDLLKQDNEDVEI